MGASSACGKILATAGGVRSGTFTTLAARDRPREKLERVEIGALGDGELLALVIGHGTSGMDALAVASAVLHAGGGLHGLTRISRSLLCQVPGVGPVLACRIQAAVELGRRTLLLSPPARLQMRTPAEAARFLLPQYGAYPVERFGVVLLDSRLRVMRVRIISLGTLDAAVAHPREVFREATSAGAAALIAFHNHPSGDPRPSKEDVELTARLRSAGDILGVDVFDHLVLADTQYCSMKESRIPPWDR